MMETETYRIGDGEPPNQFCGCGHTLAAHGSDGKVCCVCTCNQFVKLSREETK